MKAIAVVPSLFASGSAAAPPISFTGTTDGFYSVAAGQIGVSISGTLAYTFAAATITFNQAQTFAATAATVSALKFTNGTTTYYAMDTRLTVSGIAIHTFGAAAMTVATTAFNGISLVSNAQGTITLTGSTTIASFDGFVFQAGSVVITDASAEAITVLSPVSAYPATVNGSITATVNAAYAAINGNANTGVVTVQAGYYAGNQTRGSANVHFLMAKLTTNPGALPNGYVGIFAGNDGGTVATFGIRAEKAVTTVVQAGDTTIPLVYNGVLYNVLAHT